MYTISGPHCSGSESPLYKKPKAGQVCNVGIIGRNWGGTNLKLNGRRLRQVEWTIGGDFTHLRRGELGLGFSWRGEGSFKVMGLRWSAFETTWNFQLLELGRKCCIPPPISQVMEICDAVGIMNWRCKRDRHTCMSSVDMNYGRRKIEDQNESSSEERRWIARLGR